MQPKPPVQQLRLNQTSSSSSALERLRIEVTRRRTAHSDFGGVPFALSGSRWSIILYLPPYGLTVWGNLHTGHGVVLRTLTLHLPTNLPPPLHSEVIA